MLIPNAAAVYANDEAEWKALMAFLKEQDCRVGSMRTDPEKCMYSRVNNAIRIDGDRFWKATYQSYMTSGPGPYMADPEWWCVSGYDFIPRHNGEIDPDAGIADGILADIL